MAGLALVFFFYKPLNQYIRVEGKTQFQQFLGLDWVGNFLLVSGLVLLLVGISPGGTLFPWKSVGTIAPIIVGGLLVVALWAWEAFANLESPIFPRVIFSNFRGFTVIVAGVFLLGMLYYSTAVLWPQQVALLYTQDPINIGWYASSIGLAGSLVGPLAGWVFAKIGHARLLLTGTILILVACSGAQAIVTPTSNVASTALVAIIGGAMAAATIASTTMIQLGVSHEFIGIATGLAITMRSVGGSVGTTIYSSVLTSRFRTFLVSDAAVPLAKAGVDSESISHIIEAMLAGSTSELAGFSSKILGIATAGIKEAFSHALRIVYLVSIAFGVLGAVCVAFSKNVDNLMTNKVDVVLEAEEPKG